MAAGEIRGLRGEGAQGGQQRARRDSRRGGLEEARGEAAHPGRGAGALEQPRGRGLERLVVEAQRLREAVQVGDDAGVEVARDQGEQLEAHPVAQVAPRAVAAVGAPAQAARREPGLDLRAPREQQGVHEQSAVARGRDAAEGGGPAAGKHAHEDRLGLVVRGVRERHAGAAAPREAQEKAEPLLPRQLLHRGAPPLRGGEGASEAEVEAQAEAARDPRRRGRVALCGGAAQPVVEVRHVDIDPEPPARGQQQVEQAGGVGAAGEGGEDARPGREQPVPGRVGEERRQH